jgi:TolB-like protein
MPKKGYRLSVGKQAARPTRKLPFAFLAVAACVFGTIVALYYNATRSPPSARAPVVAILPFTDLSPASHIGYLNDAISEGIITNLARNPELTVIARNSSFRFRDKSADITEIGSTLGADFVLEGSQQYDGANLRVTAQLIDAHENAHVWADSLDVPLQDLFEVNSRISNQVADAVGTAIIDSGGPSHREGEVSALLLANQGRRLITSHLSKENWKKTMALNERAIKEFPDAPWGYIGQAFMLRNGVRWGWTSEPKDVVLGNARELALHAVELAPENYMAHFALGRVYMQSGDMGRPSREWKRQPRLIRPRRSSWPALLNPIFIWESWMRSSI